MKILWLLATSLTFGINVRGQQLYTEASLQSLMETVLPNGTKHEAEVYTYLKDSMLKVVTKTAFAETTVFIDGQQKKLTTLNEIMGKKIGFYVNMPSPSHSSDSIIVVLNDSTKMLNGIDCKKAELIYHGRKDKINKATVWYTQAYKFSNPTMGLSIPGVDKLPGFPISVKLESETGIGVFYTVSKIDVVSAIPVSTFDIPGDYQLMTLEDYKKEISKLMQSGNK